MAGLPEGKLLSVLDGKHSKWYYCNHHTRTYLSKRDRSFAEQLAVKKYLQAKLDDLLHEKNALDAYLAHHSADETATNLATSPAYQELLAPIFTPLSRELTTWQNAPYPGNPLHPEQLCIKASSGKFVRSKSEALIDMALYQNKIPFRYECPLQLGQTTLYPDFTLRHPATGSFYYWEHFGLMNDANYCKNVASKLELYSQHGIIPSINLITTYENKEHPLSPDMIAKTIDFYFK